MLAIALSSILVSSFAGSLIQSKGYSIEITDLRGEENAGQYIDPTTGLAVDGVQVKGNVDSGSLYMPKDASAENPLPGIVLTHGYLNNRELQMPNAVELARRGFIVLAVDREGHGNYENSGNQNAMMATKGLYDSAKYLYNLPEVDKSKIGVSGHSMGGMTTTTIVDPMISMFMGGQCDAYDPTKWAKGEGYGIISAALIQGWSTIAMPISTIDVGILKAKDDEFFFTSQDVNGEPTICREYLQSQAAASFVGDYSFMATNNIDIKNGGIYVGGKLQEEIEDGKQVVGENGEDVPFRVVYEANEIHPLNHFSTESTGYVCDFFYKAFGTPKGHKAIKTTNQVWWLKEATATIGWAGIIFMIFPLVSLLLTLPFFANLRRRRLETADGRIYGGCNIENVSYGLTNCAERTAMFQAIANGEKELVRMAVCADTPEPVAPCGACRQVMVELGPQMELLLINKEGKQIHTTVERLMPYCFDDFPQLRENDDEGEV